MFVIYTILCLMIVQMVFCAGMDCKEGVGRFVEVAVVKLPDAIKPEELPEDGSLQITADVIATHDQALDEWVKTERQVGLWVKHCTVLQCSAIFSHRSFFILIPKAFTIIDTTDFEPPTNSTTSLISRAL